MSNKQIILQGASKEILKRELALSKGLAVKKLEECECFVLFTLKGNNSSTCGSTPIDKIGIFVISMRQWEKQSVNLGIRELMKIIKGREENGEQEL